MPLVEKYLDKIFVFDLEPIPDTLHKEIYTLIEQEFLISLFGYIGGRNICLDNIKHSTMSQFTNQLYEIFLFISESTLGSLTLLENNSKICWANLSDSNYYLANIHNHTNTSTINGVYYFNMPKDCGGELDFFDEKKNLIQTIQPKQSQLIIFPSYLNHKNRYCNSDRFRISINLEINCKESF